MDTENEIIKCCGSCAFYNKAGKYCLLTLEEHGRFDVPDCDKYKGQFELNYEFEKRKRKIKESLISKLKPCPFCGEKVKIMDDLFSRGRIDVYCSKCNLTMTSKNDLEQVVEKWNKRIHG